MIRGRTPGVALPVRELVEHYRVRGRGQRLVENGDSVTVRINGTSCPLPAEAVTFAQWAAGREYFTWEAGRRAHAKQSEEAVRRALTATIDAGLVERL